MSEYKRLTEKKLRDTDIYPVLDENGNVIVDRRLFNRFIEQHNRLAELEDQIEQGTLKKLPCKVGDTVYYTSPEYYNSLLVEYKVTEISQTREGIRLAVYGSPKEKGLITYLWESYIGKTVFLTREEAEKRLKELQG